MKNRFQNGFTIVELLIVIVVIGILVGLVLNTYAGIQAKARDTERLTDMTTLAKQLEVLYVEKGHYPGPGRLTGVDAPTYINSNMPGLSLDVLAPPGLTASGINVNKNATASTYGYRPYIPGGLATNTLCNVTTESQCQTFEIYWYSESKAAVQTISSLKKD